MPKTALCRLTTSRRIPPRSARRSTRSRSATNAPPSSPTTRLGPPRLRRPGRPGDDRPLRGHPRVGPPGDDPLEARRARRPYGRAPRRLRPWLRRRPRWRAPRRIQAPHVHRRRRRRVDARHPGRSERVRVARGTLRLGPAARRSRHRPGDPDVLGHARNDRPRGACALEASRAAIDGQRMQAPRDVRPLDDAPPARSTWASGRPSARRSSSCRSTCTRAGRRGASGCSRARPTTGAPRSNSPRRAGASRPTTQRATTSPCSASAPTAATRSEPTGRTSPPGPKSDPA